ncbi:MAG: hypothetical protein KAS66_04690 [Candidatus Omnitrophica bacterium]|nr:hypothetical protein [Candidatus Omnitrophota bacterium]
MMNNINTDINYKKTILNTLIAVALWGIIEFLCYRRPVLYTYLVTEDYWGEYGTAVCCLLAAFLIIWAMFRDKSLRKSGYFLFTLGLFFLGMEEISWGQRIVGVETPHIIAQYNFQEEINVHNLFRPLPLELIAAIVILGWMVALPFLRSKSKMMDRWISKLGIPLVPVQQWPFFILVLVFLFDPVTIRSDEIGELFLGFAFLLFAKDILMTTPGKRPLSFVPAPVLGVALMMLTVSMTGVLVSCRANEGYLKKTLNLFAGKFYPKAGAYAQSETVFRFLIGNPQWMTEETLYEYGMVLSSQGKEEEASGIFRRALAREYKRAQENPDKPKPNLRAGRILKLLKREDRARIEFMKAIEKDNARYPEAQEDWEKAEILTSAGKTYFEMEDYAKALNYFRKSYDIYEAKSYREMLNGWIGRSEKALRKE